MCRPAASRNGNQAALVVLAVLVVRLRGGLIVLAASEAISETALNQ
jgi:hypothetical protein